MNKTTLKRRLTGVWLYLCLSAGIPGALAQSSNRYAYLYENLPFDMPLIDRPVFPAGTVNLAETGGVADGSTLNTEAFERAMVKLDSAGGGTLVVPAGIWFTGPIVFRSNINLHLEQGALILFSPDFDLYPLVETSYEGLDTYRCQAPLSGRNLHNIAITGEGAIDGSGQAWRPLRKDAVDHWTWRRHIASGGVLKDGNYWFPSEQSLQGELINANTPHPGMTRDEFLAVKDYLRPVLVSFIECENVLLEGVLFQNSPAWNIHPLMCRNVIVDNITVRNPAYAQNGDGIDLESCVNSIIVNSSFDVGDDAICVKSGKNEDGLRRARPTENLIVDNCRVFSGHGGFVVGSEMSGGVRNVSVSDCQFLGTDIGLRFKAGRGRGGVVENIYIDRIRMFDIAGDAFVFDLYYGGNARKDKYIVPPVDETTPVFRNIRVSNITCRNARRAMFFNGLPEMNISDIRVRDSFITAKTGVELSEADGVWFENVTVIPAEGPLLKVYNVKNLSATGLSSSGRVGDVVVEGERNDLLELPTGAAAGR